jgi:hypothetical protein
VTTVVVLNSETVAADRKDGDVNSVLIKVVVSTSVEIKVFDIIAEPVTFGDPELACFLRSMTPFRILKTVTMTPKTIIGKTMRAAKHLIRSFFRLWTLNLDGSS